jgi:parallel beta-helix repeat protein
VGSRWRTTMSLLVALLAGVAIASSATLGARATATASDPSAALEAQQVARIRAMAAAAGTLHAPARLLFDGQATLVLPVRAKPYTGAELQSLFPASWVRQGAGVWLLKDHLLVGRGAELDLSLDEVSQLRLRSEHVGFVVVASWGGTIKVTGNATHKLLITSWDPGRAAPDTTETDGRSYLVAKGGRMDVTDAAFTKLGFGTGESSGVAWRGWPGEPTRGSVLGSQFVHNHFGAFTFEAVDMLWTGNVFAGNDVYGFDPHDQSNGFRFVGNVAFLNGKHGIIFSRGCSGNLVAGNLTFLNRANGIVIDDGRVANDGNPRHAHAVPSDRNVVRDNVVLLNQAGITVQGGSGNTVDANMLVGNHAGIRVSAAATGTVVEANQILATSTIAIDLRDGPRNTVVSDNWVQGAEVGITVSNAGGQLTRNHLAGMTARAIVFQRDVRGSSATLNALSGTGSTPIATTGASGLVPNAINHNDVGGWGSGAASNDDPSVLSFVLTHPSLATWALVLLVPLLLWIPARRRQIGSAVRRRMP